MALDIPDWLHHMPKTDLHCHLGGSIRPQTILELASQNGIKLPADNIDGLRQHIVYKNRPRKSLADYLDAIKICESVLTTPDAFYRAAYELCQDAAAENVEILEVRFGPTNYERPGLPLYTIMESVLAGLEAGSRDYPLHTGLIVCGIRTDIQKTAEAAELAVNYQGSGVVGFDIAGKENGYRPHLFEKAVKPVLHNFLPITVHAGEEDSVASIAEALIYLNARRIGHGVSLRESPKALEYMDNARIAIESCITSNIDTGSVQTLSTHPIRTYYQDGLRVCINTDNRTISDTTVTKEYMLLIEHLGFQQKDIYTLAKHGIKAAFMESKRQRSLLNTFDTWARATLEPEQLERDNWL